MPKSFIKKYLPDPHKVKDIKALSFLGDIIHEPNLWHINRHSVARAFFFGLFASAIPMPMQMLLAAFLAVRFSCNLPLSVALVWISNPITMPPIFYFNYLVGTVLLNTPPLPTPDDGITLEWFSATLGQIWLPLYFGSVVVGLVAGGLGYLLIHLLWRRQVIDSWQKRKRLRARQAEAGE